VRRAGNKNGDSRPCGIGNRSRPEDLLAECRRWAK
jgi:hypothetical protein